MSEPTPPPVAGSASGSAPPVLTAEAIDGVLADFRGWLEELAAQPTADPPAAADAPAVDLHTLLGQFVGLRHEVHLQTRAVRTQQELNAETLRQLSAALDALQTAAPAPAADDAGLQPLLKTLVETYDALTLANRELQRLGDQLLPALPAWLPVPVPAAPPAAPASWWARLTGAAQVQAAVRAEIERIVRPEAAAAQRARLEQDVTAARKLLTAVVAGFGMTVQRVDRALAQHELEPLAAVGQPFDAESMEAVEVVPDSGRPDGEVLEEVRRGYRWRGRMFRFAQVRVARGGR